MLCIHFVPRESFRKNNTSLPPCGNVMQLLLEIDEFFCFLLYDFLSVCCWGWKSCFHNVACVSLDFQASVIILETQFQAVLFSKGKDRMRFCTAENINVVTIKIKEN